MAAVLGLLAAVLNLLFCSFMMRMESKMTRDGKLPRSGILRMKSYNFFMLGDRVFVTLMDFAILYVLTQGWPLSLGAVAISVLVAFAWTAIWHDIWMKPRHRVVSLLGKVHLVYFATQYMLGFMGLWMVGYMLAGYRLWSGVVAVVVTVGLASATAYFVTLSSDIGKFKRPSNTLG